MLSGGVCKMVRGICKSKAHEKRVACGFRQPLEESTYSGLAINLRHFEIDRMGDGSAEAAQATMDIELGACY